jgi:hypothetical protein
VKFPVSSAIQGVQNEIIRLRGEEGGKGQIAVLESDLALLYDAQSLDAELARLTETRKALQAGNLKDKHHLTGSILLGAGVTVSILGAFNTYMRAGKLFPGPHLYGGMAITILWAGKFTTLFTLRLASLRQSVTLLQSLQLLRRWCPPCKRATRVRASCTSAPTS